LINIVFFVNNTKKQKRRFATYDERMLLLLAATFFASWIFSIAFESPQLLHAEIAARCRQQLRMKPRLFDH